MATGLANSEFVIGTTGFPKSSLGNVPLVRSVTAVLLEIKGLAGKFHVNGYKRSLGHPWFST